MSFHADEIRNKRVDVLRALRPIPEDRGETFVAVKLFVDNWRWQDVLGCGAGSGGHPGSVLGHHAGPALHRCGRVHDHDRV